MALKSIQGEVQLSLVEEAATTWWGDVSLVMLPKPILDEIAMQVVE